MLRLASFAALPLAALALAVPAAAAPKARPAPISTAIPADLQFKAIGDAYIAAVERLSPVEATALGLHGSDSRLPDITPAGRLARQREWQRLLARIGQINPARLGRDQQVDRAMLVNELRYRLWSDLAAQDWAWNPQIYNDVAAGSLYTLAARDFAPWDVRLKAATARMEALPAFLAESRRQLVPGRVPKIFAETVSKQNGGIVEIAETMLAPPRGQPERGGPGAVRCGACPFEGGRGRAAAMARHRACAEGER